MGAQGPLGRGHGPAALSVVAAMPLEERIGLLVVATSGAAAFSVTSDAFERVVQQTGLRVFSMSSAGVAAGTDAGAAVARAVIAGYDLVADVADVDAAFFGIAAAVDRGELSLDRIDAAVARILLTTREAAIVTR